MFSKILITASISLLVLSPIARAAPVSHIGDAWVDTITYVEQYSGQLTTATRTWANIVTTRTLGDNSVKTITSIMPVLPEQ